MFMISKRKPSTKAHPRPQRTPFDRELSRRMRGPQRHRLLHGYPMAPLMEDVEPSFDPWSQVSCDPARPLLVGVIPHTLCNPRVRGCGFCTFPHEAFRRDRAEALVDRVVQEIERTGQEQPHLLERRVDALYIGGGTANLTPTRALERLGRTLASHFEIATAEHTLEGAPAYFCTRDGEGLATLQEAMGSTRLRISMGIQTFDEERLETMGRLHMGRREHVARAVGIAQRLGATTSGDLLINLPGQTLPQMQRDVDEAIGLGLDQICIYHLVLFPRLGTEWSRDAGLLAQLPDNERAYEHWAALREQLLSRGYVQRTLTNFERIDVPQSRRFLYEDASFHPDHYDAVGFGPAGISTVNGHLKWCNADTADDYVQRMDSEGHARARAFVYDETDQRLLTLTRGLARLEVSTNAYRARFGTELERDFAEPLRALQMAGLMEIRSGESVRLTPRGMFFADSVAGLLAWGRTLQLRRDLPPNAAQMSMMG